MTTRNVDVADIIGNAVGSAALLGLGLAQIPGLDIPGLKVIQAAMIKAIASRRGISITVDDVAVVLMAFAAKYAIRAVSQWLFGWIPLIGNFINAATAAVLTEAVGEFVDAYFLEQRFLSQ